MAVQKLNIKQYIKDKPKLVVSNNKQPTKGGSLMDGPLVAMAQVIIDKLTTIQKIGIGLVIYSLISGVIANGYLIIKLITLVI